MTGTGLHKSDLAVSARGVRVVRHQSPRMRFEIAFAEPDAFLRRYVRGYVGGSGWAAASVRRRELPSGNVPLIIGFGTAVRVRRAGATERWDEHTTFAAGLHDAHTMAESSGSGEGIQVDFTALGARLFYDRPLDDLANRSVELSDILGPAAGLLVEELFNAPSWVARFTILDRAIGARIREAGGPAQAVTRAWQELSRTGGRVRIQELVGEIGWSERHFATQFRAQFGLSPKAFARVLRFGRAVRALTTSRGSTLSDVALDCGYFDQAHFTRDFGDFAGVTPLELLKERLPAEAGFSAV